MEMLDRVKELGKIKKVFEEADKNFLVLYGRRRLGKTLLLKEATKGKKAIFFSCPQSTEMEALRLFQEHLGRTFNDDILKHTEFRSWQDILAYAFKKCSQEKVSLIFDEFPYLMKSVKGVDAMIQHLWDHQEGSLSLALCGSILSIMENDVLSASAPLYGRRTEQLELLPMSFFDISLFYPHLSFKEKVYMYSFLGGIPAYARRAVRYSSSLEALLDLIFHPMAVFYHEPEFLLREEIREPASYFSILHAIACGCTKLNEIAQKSGVLHNSVNKYIDTLVKMRIVKRVLSITDKPSEKSKGSYVISDHFLRFWFKFVFPYKSIIELERGEYLWEKISQDYDSYIGFIYEEIAQDFIKIKGEQFLKWIPLNIGCYKDPQNEIDIIAESELEKKVAFFECKWSENVDMNKILFKLEIKARSVKKYQSYKHEYYVVSRSVINHPSHIFLGESS